ncbi:hypothetical protein OHA27_36025 [Streptomyces sp. NBC_01619]|uniref:Uncharacterized protein n=1 Tax=Streptomyces pratisoli TaxID=3139917 RepID=A0ACC6QV22_9ACTN|nr:MULTISPECIES: hypothetical protein [unclassified Streptomyces]MCX4515619.1 hypothetical protein [Streptomyces sp. NBC_01619]
MKERRNDRSVDGARTPAIRTAHRAVPQAVHVIDAVGAHDHATHQRHHFRRGEGTGAVLRRGQLDELVGQSWQTAPLGQPHHRLQAAVRDQVRVVERGRDRRCGMGRLHLGSALPIVPDVVLA